jgi:hypothetical protein
VPKHGITLQEILYAGKASLILTSPLNRKVSLHARKNKSHIMRGLGASTDILDRSLHLIPVEIFIF